MDSYKYVAKGVSDDGRYIDIFDKHRLNASGEDNDFELLDVDDVIILKVVVL